MNINFNPFPILETKRLILRQFNQHDINDIYEMRSNPKMIEFTDGKIDEKIEDTHDYIDKMIKGILLNKWIIWAIVLKENDKLIGTISLWNINEEDAKAELGYGLNPFFWNHGYMKEALDKVTEYGFDVIKLSTIEAYTEANNIPSINLLKKSKYKQIGRIEEEAYFKNELLKMLIFSKDKKDI